MTIEIIDLCEISEKSRIGMGFLSPGETLHVATERIHLSLCTSPKQRGAPGRGLKVVRAFNNLGGGFMEFDAEFKFAKIQNSHVEGEGVGGVHGI